MSLLVARVGPQVNRFEQVASDGHQMSLAGVGQGVPMSDTFGGEDWRWGQGTV